MISNERKLEVEHILLLLSHRDSHGPNESKHALFPKRMWTPHLELGERVPTACRLSYTNYNYHILLINFSNFHLKSSDSHEKYKL